MLVTVLTAHPDPDSFNHALARAYVRGAEAAGAEVRLVDVPTLAFDPVLRGAYRTPMQDEPDLADLRATIVASGHLAWFFPVWWVGLPAVLKGLIDRLLLPDWAFRFEGGALPRGLLAGRSSRYVATMDSPRFWYQLANHDALAGSFGRGTLRFVGLAPVERTMIYAARGLSPTARAAWLARLEAQGRDDVRALRRRAPIAALTAAPASALPTALTTVPATVPASVSARAAGERVAESIALERDLLRELAEIVLRLTGSRSRSPTAAPTSRGGETWMRSCGASRSGSDAWIIPGSSAIATMRPCARKDTPRT